MSIKGEFTMRVIRKENEMRTLEIPEHELKALQVVLAAGLKTDPSITGTNQNSANALHAKTASISAEHGRAAALPLSQNEFFDLKKICEAVDTLDPEVYYQDLLETFPSDDQLTALTEHIAHLYEQEFPMKLE